MNSATIVLRMNGDKSRVFIDMVSSIGYKYVSMDFGKMFDCNEFKNDYKRDYFHAVIRVLSQIKDHVVIIENIGNDEAEILKEEIGAFTASFDEGQDIQIKDLSDVERLLRVITK